MDDLGCIVAEVQTATQLINGLQSGPEEEQPQVQLPSIRTQYRGDTMEGPLTCWFDNFFGKNFANIFFTVYTYIRA